eukprot:TRINITY_DN34574_c0_g1_i2.p1 TRINITY_DN34574_c0_g1~~TRINITY_DN34574_c0_g1_i2.p1  ORF type:complete len:253 (-),score=21.90 TRINITY_DN34574_c0_g1_i2:82-840(-)
MSEPTTHDGIVREVLAALEDQGVEAADILMCMFYAAITSFRRGTLCHPFPPEFIVDGANQYDRVEAMLRDLPNMVSLRDMLRDTTLPSNRIDDDTLRLVRWIITMRDARLRLVNMDELSHATKVNFPSSSESSTSTSRPSSRRSKPPSWVPQYAFEIRYADETGPFFQLRASHNTHIAFHGSPFENWWSILHRGLQVQFQKETNIFGDGIYFSDDPQVAHSFVQQNSVWNGSVLGGRLGCIGGCEILTLNQL